MKNGKCCRGDSDNEWMIEQDLDALCRAAAVHKDPARLKKAQELAKKRLEDNKQRRDQYQKMVDLGEGKNP